MFWNKKVTKGKQQDVRFVDKTDMGVIGSFVMENRYPHICAKACSVCWDKPIPTEFQSILEYLSKRVKIGHESVLEHSNLILYFTVDESCYEDFIDFASANKYLRIAAHHSTLVNSYHVLIGGSIRAYKAAMKAVVDQRNKFVSELKNVLYAYSYKELFIDMIDDGVMAGDSFVHLNPTATSKIVSDELSADINGNITIENFDSYKALEAALENLCVGYKLIFSVQEMCDMLSVTILFKNMSRTGTHQLVRHRNAITQESQRYVDYSEACFANPAKFKPDKYDPKEVYEITFGGSTANYTLDELGAEMQKIYTQLRNPSNGSTPLLKEDARGFLPGNIECKRLYMTFTYTTLLAFLHLRCDPAAQAEIRKYATEIQEFTMSADKLASTTADKLSTVELEIFGADSPSGIDRRSRILSPAYMLGMLDDFGVVEVLEEEVITEE